jgi:septal ring factor EnvC (AmiA/AmiB activator)
MGKILTFEQMMALFAEGRKEAAELRKSMAEETAKLRKNMADGFAESRKETAKLSASIARLEDITEKTNARLDATIVEMRENTAQMKINNHNMGCDCYCKKETRELRFREGFLCSSATRCYGSENT